MKSLIEGSDIGVAGWAIVFAAIAIGCFIVYSTAAEELEREDGAQKHQEVIS